MLSSKSYKYALTDNLISIDTVSVSNLNTLQGDSIYRTTKTAYATNSFYTKGLVLSTSHSIDNIIKCF